MSITPADYTLKMNPSFFLFLDDLRDTSYLNRLSGKRVPGSAVLIPEANKFVLARTMHEAITLIRYVGFPSVVALDHDLGDNTPSGYDFVKWLIDQDLEHDWMRPEFVFIIHSMNPVGGKQMLDTLTRYHQRKDFNKGEK